MTPRVLENIIPHMTEGESKLTWVCGAPQGRGWGWQHRHSELILRMVVLSLLHSEWEPSTCFTCVDFFFLFLLWFKGMRWPIFKEGVCVCVWCRYLWRTEEGIRCPKAGVADWKNISALNPWAFSPAQEVAVLIFSLCNETNGHLHSSLEEEQDAGFWVDHSN